MNLINFHKYEKNKQYIRENTLKLNAQGITDIDYIMVNGNGYNKYLFILENVKDNIHHKISIDEKHIEKWDITNYFACEKNIVFEADFEAVGKIEETNQYIYLYNRGNDIIKINNTIFKLIDITIENEYPNKPHKIYSGDEMNYIMTDLQETRNLIYDILEFPLDKPLKINIDYDMLNDEKNWNKMMYFISDNKKIIPFEIIHFEKIDKIDGKIKGYIYHEFNKIYIDNIEIRDYLQIDEIGIDYDTLYPYIINIENKEYDINIYKDCYIIM
jgi:hypothetical protein